MPKVKKHRTVLAKTPLEKPKTIKKKPTGNTTTVPVRPRTPATWNCSSVIDQQAAEAVAKLLAAAETRTSGATIKSLTLAPHVVHKKPTFAVTCETLKYLPLLKQLLVDTGLLEQHAGKLPQAAAYVLTYELLFGQGFRKQGPAERAVASCKEQLHAALQALLQQAAAPDAAAWLNKQQQQQQQQAMQHPRFARVNTLKASVTEVLTQLQQEFGPSTAAAVGAEKTRHNNHIKQPVLQSTPQTVDDDSVESQQTVVVDDLLPDVLVFPPGTDLHDHPLVQRGMLILQSKASCMPAHALDPQPGWQVMDCCAAPGNKTTHVAALLQAANRSGYAGNSGSSHQKMERSKKRRSRDSDGESLGAAAAAAGGIKVFAFDKDPKRLRRLQANINTTGAGHIVTATQADFLSVDPQAPQFAKVQGVILDPSCSGSGTVVSRMDHLLPQNNLDNPQQQQQQDRQEQHRIEQLAKFQEAAILHALKFPAVRRLVYSTCSVHQQENEDVVAKVLPVAVGLGFQLVDPFPAWQRRGVPVVDGSEKLVRTDPYLDGTDGFFVAVFER